MRKILICLLSFFIIISYFIYISYYHIDITTHHLESNKITENIEIVMISDLHDYNCKIQENIIEKIAFLDPDLILCVGDMIDSESLNEENLIDFLVRLKNIFPVYMSIGNHEVLYYEKNNNLYKNIEIIGVHLLEEEYEDVIIKENKIRIGGMYNMAFSNKTGDITKEDMDNSASYQFLDNMTNTSSFKLMMAHRPDSFIYCYARNWNIDLILSGHTHGGQVIIPFIGGLFAPEQGLLPKYDYGLFELGKMKMIITRGLCSSNSYIPRFNNPSEIISIQLN